MIDDRIGSIGSTHGVNDNATPITKNAPTTSQKRPLFNTLSMALPSNHAPAPGCAAGGVARRAKPARRRRPRPTCTRALPSPPKAARLIRAVLVIGG